jgi:putative ABC transport system permease protein
MKTRRRTQPPRLAEKILKWYSRSAHIEDMHGDLEELFYLHRSRMPQWKAGILYYKNVLSIIFSYALKKRKQKAAYSAYGRKLFHPAMLKNYFLIASRNLARHKFFSVINILGLAIGMSISLLLIAMVSFLWRYDDFHTNKENIYRVISLVDNVHQREDFASAPAALADKLKHDYTGIEKIVRISATFSAEARYGNKQLSVAGYFTDPEFLEVFTFPLVKGNVQHALDKPNALVMTQKASIKFFGAEEAVGKIIEVDGVGSFEVTAIVQDPPKNSHMQFEVLAPYEAFINFQKNVNQIESDWEDFHNSYVYLLLPPHSDTRRINGFLDQVARNVYTQKTDFKASFVLQSLTEIVPGPELHDEIGLSWGYASLAIFAFLTLMILLPACFNYASISISRALKRMKEIGLRKVMGGQRDQIFFQFVTETIIITLIALVISFGLFHVIQQEFLKLLVGSEGLDLEPDLHTIGLFIVFATFVGFIAGIVPALYFSKLTPIDALKAKPSGKQFRSFTLRKLLIVSQFALSAGFIMGVVIVLSQYRYALNFDFGFNQANILDVQLQEANPEIFRNEFSKMASVQKISMSSDVLGTQIAPPAWVRSTDDFDSTEVFEMFVDDQYLSNLDLTLLAGQNFSPLASENMLAVIVNEELLRSLSIQRPSDAIGRKLLLPDKTEVRIIGVVRNFHYMQLRERIKSFFFRYDPAKFRFANVRVASTDIFESISQMESIWKSIAPEKKFTARFFEDEIEDTYSFYFTMIKICGFLAFLAISISCLGLLGMVVFTVENRIKEIGIRKVMGASEASVVVLLSKQFLKLMFIAALIAVPFTIFFFENSFLKSFEYKINIGFWEIVVSLLVLMALGLTTILSQTVRAARANPVDSLRSE